MRGDGKTSHWQWHERQQSQPTWTGIKKKVTIPVHFVPLCPLATSTLLHLPPCLSPSFLPRSHTGSAHARYVGCAKTVFLAAYIPVICVTKALLMCSGSKRTRILQPQDSIPRFTGRSPFVFIERVLCVQTVIEISLLYVVVQRGYRTLHVVVQIVALHTGSRILL